MGILSEAFKKKMKELAGVTPEKHIKVTLGDLFVDAGNMDTAYYRAQDSLGDPTSESTGQPLHVYRLKDGALILADGHHRVADKIMKMAERDNVTFKMICDISFKALITDKDWGHIDDSTEIEPDDIEWFVEWLHNTGDFEVELDENVINKENSDVVKKLQKELKYLEDVELDKLRTLRKGGSEEWDNMVEKINVIHRKLYDLTGDAYGETKVDKEKKNAKPSDKLLNATYNHPFEVPKNVYDYINKHGNILTDDASDAVRFSRIINTENDQRYRRGEITIYRAVENGDEIRAGDWVTTERKYAVEHNERYFDGTGKILEMDVDGRDVLVSPTGNYEEAIYAPMELSMPIVKSKRKSIKECESTIRKVIRKILTEGIHVYHGSDRKFDVFDINQVGSGDGKSLGGWGIYFSDSPEVSKRYVTKNGFLKSFEITNGQFFNLDESLDEGVGQEILNRLKSYGSEGNHVSEENFEQFQTDFIDYGSSVNNKQVYEWLSYVLGGDREASAFLEKVGYIGTVFKDKWDSDATNYVIFNPKDINKVDDEQEIDENRFQNRNDEKYKSCLMSDLSRMQIVEDFFNQIKKNPDYNIDEPDHDELLDTWDGYEDQVYIQNNLKNNEIIYWEGWVDSCWESLYEKPEYKKLDKKDAIKKVINDRFPRIAEEFEMKIKSFNYFIHNDEYIMKVVFVKTETFLTEDSRRVDWKKQIEYISKKLNVKLIKFLGGGMFGIAYAIPGNRVLKLTEDDGEIYSSKSIVGKKSEYLANIYKVYSIKGHPDKKAIIQERLQPLNQKYIDGFRSFISKMDDFCIQNGQVFGGDVTIAEFLQDSDLYHEDFNNFLEQESFGDDDYAGVVYGDLLSIYEEAAGYGIDLVDIHEENCGIKNGHMAMFDIK